MHAIINGSELARAMRYVQDIEIDARIARWSAAGCAEGAPRGAYDATEAAECQRDAEIAEAAYKAVQRVLALLGLTDATDAQSEQAAQQG